MEERLLDKLIEVRFWKEMGMSRKEIAQLTGLRHPAVVRKIEFLLEGWEEGMWDRYGRRKDETR